MEQGATGMRRLPRPKAKVERVLTTDRVLLFCIYKNATRTIP
jgi:hypothetical protein